MDIIIKSAAVADYTPQKVSNEKIKKSENDMDLKLDKTDDILRKLGEIKRENQFICGFAMETENLLENASAKLVKKNVDMIVANNLRTEGAGFGTETNIVTLIKKDGNIELPIMTKDEVAKAILDEII